MGRTKLGVGFWISLVMLVVLAFALLWASRSFAAGLCEPMDDFKTKVDKHGAAATYLSHDELEFLRGIYAMNPLTPPGMPFGDRAMIVTTPGNDGAIIEFIDGDLACTPMPVPKSLLDLLASVAADRINHQGDPL